MRDLLPNGLLGLAIAGLLAAFMAGMAANISAFNTVFSYDLWQRYVRKDQQRRLLPADRPARDGRGDRASRSARPRSRRSYSQHHGLPADAVRVLQRPAVRDVHPRHVLEADDRRPPAGRAWSRGTGGRGPRRAPQRGRARAAVSTGAIGLSGQGASFVAAGAAFVVDIARQRARHRA